VAYYLKKLEQFLFYFLIFAIPFQTRKILWHQNWNFNEWQSASLYATDLLLIVLFLFWLGNSLKKYQVLSIKYYGGNFKFLIRNTKYLIQKPDFYLVLFLIVSAISIKNSSSYILSAYNVLKLMEFIAFYFYIKSYAVYKFGLNKSLLALICGGGFQAIIAILQFLKQSSLGLKLLGESILAPNLTGVASFFNLAGEKIMRAYGTTPHSNILAAYLFLAIFAFFYLWIHKKMPKFYLLVYGLTLLAFLFTFARVAVFMLFANFLIIIILMFLKFRKEYWNKKLALLFSVTFIVISFFSVFYWPEVVSRIKISSREEAVQLRIFYNKESLKSLNWFGVGPGNFVNWLIVKDPNLPRSLYQPVHNIYLLIYSETGILGITAFILFIAFLIKDFIVRTKMKKLYHYFFLLLFSSFLFVGLFDHFLWTLQQGRLIFWLTSAGLTLFVNGDIMIRQQSEPTAW